MNAWLFDVDGVITNLDTRRIEYPQILEKIVGKLRTGEPVGIITGRKLPWLIDTVIEPIEQQTEERSALDQLYVEAEFEGISVIYQNGQRQESIDQELSLPPDLVEAARTAMSDFNDIVFDPGKQTHFTAELKIGVSREVFERRKPDLATKFEQLVEEAGLSDRIEVHRDALAVNIKDRRLNKRLAAAKFLEWLKEKRVEPEAFYVFGDSKSDLEMGEELLSQGKRFTFVYVGEGKIKETGFKITRTSKLYDEGALEYLLSN